MGTNFFKHSNTYSRAKPTFQPTSQLPKPPTGSPLPTPLPANIMAGGTPILFPMVCTHMYPKCLPLLIYSTSCTSAILVSPPFYFVSLTFLSDLMKWLQYECQQKLVSVFIMFLLCFSTSSFIEHQHTCLENARASLKR